MSSCSSRKIILQWRRRGLRVPVGLNPGHSHSTTIALRVLPLSLFSLFLFVYSIPALTRGLFFSFFFEFSSGYSGLHPRARTSFRWCPFLLLQRHRFSSTGAGVPRLDSFHSSWKASTQGYSILYTTYYSLLYVCGFELYRGEGRETRKDARFRIAESCFPRETPDDEVGSLVLHLLLDLSLRFPAEKERRSGVCPVRVAGAALKIDEDRRVNRRHQVSKHIHQMRGARGDWQDQTKNSKLISCFTNTKGKVKGVVGRRRK